MATKKQGHTGFRNGDLFCFNCGRSYKIPYPQPISMVAELQAKGHKLIPSGDCEGFDPFGGGCPGHRTRQPEQMIN